MLTSTRVPLVRGAVACTQDGNALEFASDAMDKERDVLLAAVQTAGDVLQFASGNSERRLNPATLRRVNPA